MNEAYISHPNPYFLDSRNWARSVLVIVKDFIVRFQILELNGAIIGYMYDFISLVQFLVISLDEIVNGLHK